MKLKEVIIGVAAIALVVGGFIILLSRAAHPANAPLMPQSSMTQPAPSSAQSPSQSQSNAITIKGFAFSPTSLTVKKGTTVTWTNQDDAHHTVTSDTGSAPGGPASQLLAKGQSYSLTFGTAGTFNYHCDPHPYMKGTVVVTE